MASSWQNLFFLGCAWLLPVPSEGGEGPYTIRVPAEGPIALYSYGVETFATVYDQDGSSVWSGVLRPGEPVPIPTTSGCTYTCVGASPDPTFGVIVGRSPSAMRADAGSPSIRSQETKVRSGGAGGLKVICVSWKGDPNLPHDAYDGREITFKGTVKGLQEGLTYTYSWDFNDGISSPSTLLSDPYTIEARHAYVGFPAGTNFRAKLKVEGREGQIVTAEAEDEYSVTVRAETLDVKVNIAIDEALWYLHKRMARWTEDTGAETLDFGSIAENNGLASHAAAMEAFLFGEKPLPNRDPEEDPYIETIQRGINWILLNLAVEPVPSDFNGNIWDKQYAGYAEDYDSDGALNDGGNQIGLAPPIDSMYLYGIVLTALATTQYPQGVASPVNRPQVDGRTYKEIVQDMVDFGIWAQNDEADWRRGGWRYGANYGDSDNSVSQWPALGIFVAEKNMSVKVPSWAKEETKNYWIPYSQLTDGAGNVITGGFGYTNGGNWENLAKTAAGLILLSWVGFAPDDPRVLKAIDHITGQWTNAGPQYTNVGDFYSMYGVLKAATLTNPPIEKFGPYDWYKDYATWLVGHQDPSGFWSDTSWLTGYYNGVDIPTAWGTMILKGGIIGCPPVANLEVKPNPTDKEVPISFDGSKSYVCQPPSTPEGTTIVKYEFDFGDGSTYTETPDSHPDGAFDGKTTHTYLKYNVDAGFPECYIASLKVTDSQPQVSPPATVCCKIIPPDHPPTAVIEVASCAWESDKPAIDFEGYEGIPITFDGSKSFDIDERYGDKFIKYEWDFTAPTTFQPLDATGSLATFTFSLPGDAPKAFDVGIRVTDTGDPSWTPPGPLQGTDFRTILILPGGRLFELKASDASISPKCEEGVGEAKVCISLKESLTGGDCSGTPATLIAGATMKILDLPSGLRFTEATSTLKGATFANKELGANAVLQLTFDPITALETPQEVVCLTVSTDPSDWKNCCASSKTVSGPIAFDAGANKVQATGKELEAKTTEGSIVAQCLTKVPFLRGDANNDCRVDIADGVYIINFRFLGGPDFPCPISADANDDGISENGVKDDHRWGDLSDAVYIFNYLFIGGTKMPEPFGTGLGTACGVVEDQVEADCPKSCCAHRG